MQTSPEPKRILEGVRVLDLTQFLAGPHATLLLAGLGADVVRIDNPTTGDALSDSPIYYGSNGPSFEKRTETDLGVAFLKRLRAKKSITIDLKSSEGRSLFAELAECADVLVENYSVGVTERLEIDWPRMKQVNPRLVYCSITGYGSSGADAKRRSYDVTTQAMSGLMSITGQPGAPPTKAGSALADTISAVFAFSGVLAALYHRERTGIGQFVDVSMVDGLFSLLFDEPLDCYDRLGLDYQQGNRVMRFSPFNTFPTQDGWIVIGCGTDSMWSSFASAIGRDDLVNHSEWSRMAWRVANNEQVETLVSSWSSGQVTHEAVEMLTSIGVVASAVQNIEDLMRWPHLNERGMISVVEHPLLGPLGGLKAAGFPLQFSET
ncbi:MAG: CoA transferase, partial [Pseudomonadota bacterium]